MRRRCATFATLASWDKHEPHDTFPADRARTRDHVGRCQLLVGGPSNARADACTSGDVSIGTKQDDLLKRSMVLTVHATCEDTYDATALGYLYVAGHRTGRLQAIKLTGVQTTPTRMTITIPDRVLSATRAYARRGNHDYRYATLKFVVTSTDVLTGFRYPHAYSNYSVLRL
jgi:hypothetical protein